MKRTALITELLLVTSSPMVAGYNILLIQIIINGI